MFKAHWGSGASSFKCVETRCTGIKTTGRYQIYPKYLNATTCQWVSHWHESLHNPTAHNSTGTMTCPAVKLQDVARVGAPESDGQSLENPGPSSEN